MNAVILTIGDELLIGQVVNTNQAYLARKLNEIGIGVAQMLTVGDDMPSILDSFARAWGEYDVVVVTGGLGPTHDDITKTAVCTFFDSPLEKREELLEHVKLLLARRNIPWRASHEEQALFPAKAEVVPNPIGTAAGMRFTDRGKHFFVLPGVPYEMRAMADRSVIPFLAAHHPGGVIRHRTLRTTGATESFLASEIGPVDGFLQGATLAFLPSPTGVRLRISVRTEDDDADARISAIETILRNRVGRFIYGVDEETLEEVVGKLLSAQRKTIATAESCTGGHLADRFTDVSGSSAYFERGFITYSNASKIHLLDVSAEMIAREGAVSEAVARAMAQGARRAAGATIGVSTTGIAGPTGGTTEKPVGLVWIAYADEHTSLTKRYQFGDERSRVKERASQAVLELVWRQLTGT
jgi:nicotinamide-nucleotide amidase